jgi:flagellar assembly factor FliW
MPQVLTKYFESLEYKEADVIRFPAGFPAFEEELEFLVIEPPARAPLAFLQSVGKPGLCFLALPIQFIDPHYKLDMTLEDLECVELPTARQPVIGEDVDCLAVIAMAENAPPSANLLAPIVINRGNRLGVQAIRIDSTYSHQHPVGMAPVGKGDDTCS